MSAALKILIVDDDRSSAAALSEIVKRMGFKPIVAHKPTDALNVVRLQTVHAAIVDILLPKMTGVELVGEFRNTRFGSAPVILVSGVFKDKAFSGNALEKTKGSAFLTKPFDVDEMSVAIKEATKNLVTAEKWSVQSLLTRKLKSDRERAKAIEHLEAIVGLDFPFVLSILMEVGSSGNLNIVCDDGEIFGVTLVKGTISNVDSLESQSTAILSMVSKGYLPQEDMDDVQNIGAKRVTLDRLVEDSFVSPHAVSEARHDQIMIDLRAICSAKSLQVNFVPQEMEESPPRHVVKLKSLLDMFSISLDEFFPGEYLETFYSTMMQSPLRLVHMSQSVLSTWDKPQFRELTTLRKAIESGLTLVEALQVEPNLKHKTLQCLHYFVLMRSVMFDDLNRVKNINSMLNRFKILYENLNGKTPDKIFGYFGATVNSSPGAINNIWEEYVQSNDPSKLGREATPELKELSKKCFDLVREAKEVLLDDTKREKLIQRLADEQAENQQRSINLVTQAYDKLKNDRASEALAHLLEAEKLNTNNRWLLIYVWAEVRVNGADLKLKLSDFSKRLDAIQFEERKNPLWFYVHGLVKQAAGDPSAPAFFEKALQLDPDFSDAKRELNAPVKETSYNKKPEKVNIFTGDLTDVVSQIFRRR